MHDKSGASLPLRFGVHADLGMRLIQEDAFIADPTLGLFAVADAMGAMASGRHAADLALETLCQHIRIHSSGMAPERLAESVRAANAALFARTEAAAIHWEDRSRRSGRAHDPEVARWQGVSSTIVALLFAWEGDPGQLHAAIAHVGDSRAYRLRHRTLEQLTEDHRLVEDARRAGLSESEVEQLPPRVITAALGVRAAPRIELVGLKVEPGDLFLLCSNGLSDEVEREEMERILLANADDVNAAARALVERAVGPMQVSGTNESRGFSTYDNATAIVVRALE